MPTLGRQAPDGSGGEEGGKDGGCGMTEHMKLAVKYLYVPSHGSMLKVTEHSLFPRQARSVTSKAVGKLQVVSMLAPGFPARGHVAVSLLP